MAYPALRQVLYCTGKNPGQHTFIRLHSAPVTELLIVTSVPEKGCSMPQGDKQTVMGLMNKQDYARWHSYQFHCSIGDVDPTIRPAGALDVSTQPAPRPPNIQHPALPTLDRVLCSGYGVMAIAT